MKIQNSKFKIKNSSEGVAILFSLFLLSIILAATLTLSSIFTPKIRLSFDIKNSPSALFAADTGIEWCLYVKRKNPAAPKPILANGATFDVTPTDCTSPVRAVGTFRGVSRALEATF